MPRRLVLPMVSRDPNEHDRSSTPLEAFFDLCFVVAVSEAAAGLHEELAAGDIGAALLGYLFAFFGIWWAWMNFTWFASAYDTDDVPYRLLTLLQIAGVLVFAAGIPSSFTDHDYTVCTFGYVIMRLALITQWLRAAAHDPARRVTAFSYAVLVGLCQVGWLLRLLIPGTAGLIAFVVLAGCEIAAPWIAERRGQTNWNAGHINERFGLFTIIVLGESVAAASVAMNGAISGHGISLRLAVLALAGLVLIFAVWWLYFKRELGDVLDQRDETGRRRELIVFGWGYGHFLVFASIAAIGAGLELLFGDRNLVAGPQAAVGAFALAVPAAVFLVLSSVMHAALLSDHDYLPVGYAYLSAALLLLVAATSLILPLALVVCGEAAVLVLLLTGHLVHAALAVEARAASGPTEAPAGEDA